LSLKKAAVLQQKVKEKNTDRLEGRFEFLRLLVQSRPNASQLCVTVPYTKHKCRYCTSARAPRVDLNNEKLGYRWQTARRV